MSFEFVDDSISDDSLVFASNNCSTPIITNLTTPSVKVAMSYDVINETIWTFKQPLRLIVLYSVADSIVFVLGLVGNGLVVWVVYSNRRMHDVTNYFIVNLAVADILVCLLCLPITLLSNLYSGQLTKSL